MLFFLLAINHAKSQCILSDSIPATISNTQTSEIPMLIQKGKGCLTLVELWAGWCGSCKKVKPELHRILKKNPSLVHLSISADYTKGALKQYLKKNKYEDSGIYWLESWSIDTLTKNFKTVGANFRSAIPLIILLGPDGKILYEATEPSDLTKLDAMIQSTRNTK